MRAFVEPSMCTQTKSIKQTTVDTACVHALPASTRFKYFQAKEYNKDQQTGKYIDTNGS